MTITTTTRHSFEPGNRIRFADTRRWYRKLWDRLLRRPAPKLDYVVQEVPTERSAVLVVGPCTEAADLTDVVSAITSWNPDITIEHSGPHGTRLEKPVSGEVVDDAPEDWRDITVIGSVYEEQIEVHSSRRRHRPLRFSYVYPLNPGEERGIGEWRPGPASAA